MSLHQKKIQKEIDEINSILNIDFEELQSFNELGKLPLNQEVKFKGNIKVTKILHTKNMLRFTTIIPPRGSFNNHWHDCLEVVTILSGKLSDKIKKIESDIDSKAVYLVGEKHIPYNPSYTRCCFLIVDFYK